MAGRSAMLHKRAQDQPRDSYSAQKLRDADVEGRLVLMMFSKLVSYRVRLDCERVEESAIHKRDGHDIHNIRRKSSEIDILCSVCHLQCISGSRMADALPAPRASYAKHAHQVPP
jgi:hypothetical protein